MKQITQQQIEALLNTIYQTNISAQQFDGMKQFFLNLPDIKFEVPTEKEVIPEMEVKTEEKSE